MIRLAIFGLDGHGSVFATEVNRRMFTAKVVKAMPYPTVMVDDITLQKYINTTQEAGVKIVDSLDELAKDVDGVLVLQDDGSQHYEMATQLIKYGLPVYVDKPMEVNVKKARALVDAFAQAKCPLFSASSLRYTPELKTVLADRSGGKILSAMTWSPFLKNSQMPGWIYYALHSVEPLFELMGPGFESVECTEDKFGSTAIGHWADGRCGIVRATTAGVHGYGFTVWREHQIITVNVNIDTIYQGLLDAIVSFFETKVAPTNPEHEVEVVRFLQAVNHECGIH